MIPNVIDPPLKRQVTGIQRTRAMVAFQNLEVGRKERTHTTTEKDCELTFKAFNLQTILPKLL